jgi:hypothetical protein
VSLPAASLTAQVISFALLITTIVLVVGPWMNRKPLAVALGTLLWIHAFRYVALQIFSAQRFGFAISDALASEIAWGDVAATLLAIAGLWLLHFRSPVAKVVAWVLVIESVIDLANATLGGIRENALESATGVTWLILSFYVPALWVSTGLMAWLLVLRRGQAFADQPANGSARVLATDLHPKEA